MAGCQRCGRQTSNSRLCSECARADHYDQCGRDIDWAACPDCGGPTSGEDVTCRHCRRDDDRGPIVVDSARVLAGVDD